MEIRWVELDSLTPYEKNSKKHPQEQIEKLAKEIKEVGWTQPIVVDKNFVIVAGHGRRLAAMKAGINTVPVYVLPDNISKERIRAIRLFDNKTAETGWDENILKSELIEIASFDGFSNDWVGYDFQELVDILPEDHSFIQDKINVKEVEIDNNELEKYTSKIEPPIYAPTGEKPDVTELADLTKTLSLIQRINESKNLPVEIIEFLRAAATRHTVFNYAKIAEFYAHADKSVQSLMEDSALVIIDYKKAIEGGFMKLSKANAELAE